jgi:hypothetical protein
MSNEEYIDLISREPLEFMIEQGKGYRYIKKSVLKKELLKIFGGHTKFEVTDKSVSINGLYCTGLFHYKHPVSGEWLFESGMAAIPHDKSMRLNYPALKAQIFKNAVREIGVWFGQTLNLDTDDAEPEETSIKAEPDIIILKKYDNAVKAKDEKTIKEIEENYNIL